MEILLRGESFAGNAAGVSLLQKSLSPGRGTHKEGVSFLWKFFSGESSVRERYRESLPSRNPSQRTEGR